MTTNLAPSTKGEGWDEGEINHHFILFYSPHPTLPSKGGL